MKSLRISIPISYTETIKEAASHFNQASAYWKDVKLKIYKNHSVLELQLDEAVLFIEAGMAVLSRFARERLRQLILDELISRLKEDPGHIRLNLAKEALASKTESQGEPFVEI